MFSVIIPLYNKAAYIEKAIHSVLSQTFQEFELIVVNDGSTDDPLPPNGGSVDERLERLGFLTPQLDNGVRSFSPPLEERSFLTPPLGGWGVKIRIIEQENQGVSTARNNGAKLARFDYIAFLDADDWWESTYLEEMKGLIEAYPEAGIYASGYNIVKNGNKRIAPIGVESGFSSGLINYCQVYAKTLCMPLTSISVVIPKSVFESEKGFKPTLKLGEDFDLWVRIAMKYTVAFVNKPLANYNQDVELANRAIGEKLYEPHEHILFSDYRELNNNPDFRFLYERLALYGLLPYYLAEKNKIEVKLILSGIHWSQHTFKYQLFYKLLPKHLVSLYKELMSLGSQIKRRINAK